MKAIEQYFPVALDYKVVLIFESADKNNQLKFDHSDEST